jgi:hypothetical protein
MLSPDSNELVTTTSPNQQSYFTGNKIFCIYKAENEEALWEHATKGRSPITSITEINTTISPKTAKNKD